MSWGLGSDLSATSVGGSASESTEPRVSVLTNSEARVLALSSVVWRAEGRQIETWVWWPTPPYVAPSPLSDGDAAQSTAESVRGPTWAASGLAAKRNPIGTNNRRTGNIWAGWGGPSLEWPEALLGPKAQLGRPISRRGPARGVAFRSFHI